jgi:hypothetical protein
MLLWIAGRQESRILHAGLSRTRSVQNIFRGCYEGTIHSCGQSSFPTDVRPRYFQTQLIYLFSRCTKIVHCREGSERILQHGKNLKLQFSESIVPSTPLRTSLGLGTESIDSIIESKEKIVGEPILKPILVLSRQPSEETLEKVEGVTSTTSQNFESRSPRETTVTDVEQKRSDPDHVHNQN